MRDDRERLTDILEAITRIEKYADGGREAFERSELVQTWIVYHVQIIGEAAGNVSPVLRSRHPEIAWPQIVAMRNLLVHEYFGIDTEEVWATVEYDIPVVKRHVEAILREAEGPPSGVMR